MSTAKEFRGALCQRWRAYVPLHRCKRIVAGLETCPGLAPLLVEMAREMVKSQTQGNVPPHAYNPTTGRYVNVAVGRMMEELANDPRETLVAVAVENRLPLRLICRMLAAGAGVAGAVAANGPRNDALTAVEMALERPDHRLVRALLWRPAEKPDPETLLAEIFFAELVARRKAARGHQERQQLWEWAVRCGVSPVLGKVERSLAQYCRCYAEIEYAAAARTALACVRLRDPRCTLPPELARIVIAILRAQTLL